MQHREPRIEKHTKQCQPNPQVWWVTSLSGRLLCLGLLMEETKRKSGTVGTSNDLVCLFYLDCFLAFNSLPPTPTVPRLSFSSLANCLFCLRNTAQILFLPLVATPWAVPWSSAAQMIAMVAWLVPLLPILLLLHVFSTKQAKRAFEN